MALFTGHTITPDSALGGIQIQRSLRFNSGASQYITRTCSSEGNRVKWTWSGWVKKTRNGRTSYALLSSDNGGDGGGNNGIASIYFHNSGEIHTYYDTTGSNNYGAINSNLYRDTNSWYHIVWQVDAANSTSKIWVNGVEQSIASGSQPVSGYNYTMNQSGKPMAIGVDAWDLYTFSDTYIAETHYSDGQLYAASDFGYTDAQTGQWRPKNGNVIKSNITYGTNGFWLDFRDATSTTTLGYDYSGNGNHWTLVNMSVANNSNVSFTSDTPTNNFCTLNPLDAYGDGVSEELRFGNLQAKNTSSSYRTTRSTVHVKTGKWYYEATVLAAGSNFLVGVAGPDYVAGSGARRAYNINGQKYGQDGFGYSYGNTYTTNDVIGVAIDLDNGTLTFYKNGTSQGVAFTDLLTYLSGIGWTPIFNGNSNSHAAFNFGQRPFSYTPPTGHRALSGHNLATVDAAGVVRPKRFFDPLLYTGTGSSNIVEGLEFSPDMIWVKGRDTNGTEHLIIDSVRGGTKSLVPNSDDVESTHGGRSMTFYPGGVRWNSDSNTCNANGENYVMWCWKAGGSSSTYNIDGTGYGTASAAGLDGGSINPTGASVNTESGFGIYTYTGTGSNATIAHGLGRKPAWIIIKNRNATSGSTENWTVYHQGNTDNPETEYLTLNGTSATADLGTIWNDTEPTLSLISIGTHARVNESASVNYIMYVWSEIPGFSKFGSYKGNSNSDGSFVHIGFRPAFLILKRTDDSKSWILFDNKRSPSNLVDKSLYPNRSDGDNGLSNLEVDFLSTGFKLRNSVNTINDSGGTYVYMAFAEQPSGTIFGRDANAR